MVSAITAIPALLLKAAQPKRPLNWYALCASVVVQCIVKGYSISNIKWILAQAALESNWGDSSLSQRANNYFGMWKPSQREYFADGTTSGFDGLVNAEYLKYRSAWQCAKDRLAWDAEFNTSVLPYKASAAYPQAVASRYHASPSYAASVIALRETHANDLSFAVWVSLLAVPLEFYVVTKIFG